MFATEAQRFCTLNEALGRSIRTAADAHLGAIQANEIAGTLSQQLTIISNLVCSMGALYSKNLIDIQYNFPDGYFKNFVYNVLLNSVT
jgi:hypothetical protein